MANDVLGGDFLSRINMDLRESEGLVLWRSTPSVRRVQGPIPYHDLRARAGQSDGAGDRADPQTDMAAFLGDAGDHARWNASARSTAASANFRAISKRRVMCWAGSRRSINIGWADDYYETLADRYRAMTVPQLDAAIRKVIDPAKLLWIVVGDAAGGEVRSWPRWGMPVEVMQPQDRGRASRLPVGLQASRTHVT